MINTFKRIIGLDVLRAIAVLAVVFSHTIEYLYPLRSIVWLEPILASISETTHLLGIMGVELFFGLSGYLIGGILIRSYNKTENFSWAEVANFWKRRWFRTLPNYWVVLTLNIVLYAILGLSTIKPFQALYYFFIQNFCTTHPRFFFGEAWSLSVEEWFYILLPLAFLALPRSRNLVTKSKLVFSVIFAYLILFTVVRFINAQQPLFGNDQDFGIRKVVVLRFDALMFGVFWSALNIYRKAIFEQLKYWALGFGIVGIVATYYLVVGYNITSTEDQPIRMWSDALLYTMLPLIFSCLLPYASSVKQLSNRWIQSLVLFISKLSYSIYLVHYSLLYIPFFYKQEYQNPSSRITYYGLYWGLLLALSWMLYKFIEQPFMRLRDKKTLVE